MGNGRSKEAFRNVLQQLNERDVSPSDTALWEKLWTTESTPHVSDFQFLYDSRPLGWEIWELQG